MFYQHAGRVNSDVKCLACTVPPSLHAKRFLLVDLITIHSQAGKTIVFCNTKRECEAVVSAVSGIARGGAARRHRAGHARVHHEPLPGGVPRKFQCLRFDVTWSSSSYFCYR